MIVYMLLNTATELVYVGATEGTLADRWERHLKESTSRTSRLGAAMSEWEPEFWERVVLCNCYSVQELSDAEAAWQKKCSAFDPGIGYNEHRGSYRDTVKAGKQGGSSLHSAVKPGSPLAGMSTEQRREYFRAAGKRGAAKSRSMS